MFPPCEKLLAKSSERLLRTELGQVDVPPEAAVDVVPDLVLARVGLEELVRDAAQVDAALIAASTQEAPIASAGT